MDYIQQLNLGTAAELALTTLVVFVLTQAVKQTKVPNQWMPWLSMGVGVVVGLLSVFVTADHNFLSGAVMGLLVGGFTSGLFDGFKGFNVKEDDK
ncbi:holin [Levilactobacillus wangkuiensis]|uniref:holin n=1 Tax=Levilactobacillus wangkuiensis TaxID=2799566 RepID=UPI001F24D056|nr:holin [Levilactobacillus wangkuiensis]